MNQNLVWQTDGIGGLEDQAIIIRALVRSGTKLTVQRTNLEFLFVANMPEQWQNKAGGAPSDENLFGDELAARLKILKLKVLNTGGLEKLEASDETDQVYEFIVETEKINSGQFVLITTIVDITEERRRETALKSLLREVSHRSKNMLAIVQSMANQTARNSTSLTGFLTTFRGRIQSLSFSQDLVTESSWRGAKLHALIQKQIGLYLEENSKSIRVEGKDVELTPNGATHIGLAIHELVVNAVGRSTMEQPIDQPITILIDVQADDTLILQWCETLPPQTSSIDYEDTIDFDSVLLSRIVPQSLSGQVSYAIDKNTLIYELKCSVKK